MCKFTNSMLLAAGMMVSAGLAGTASATVIYQDSFTGSSTLGSLNGAKPTIDTGNATWTAPSSGSYGFSDSGYFSASQNTTRYVTAFLPFVPTAGEVYTLSASFDITSLASASNDYGAWAGLGFMTASPTPGSGWDGGGASPWEMTTANLNGGGGNAQAYEGTTMRGVVNNAPGVETLSLLLDTNSSQWSFQGYLTDSAGTFEVGSGTLNPNPGIIDVGMQSIVGTGQISNFSMSATAVPSPATLDVFGVGGLALLLIGCKRQVRA